MERYVTIENTEAKTLITFTYVYKIIQVYMYIIVTSCILMPVHHADACRGDDNMDTPVYCNLHLLWFSTTGVLQVL